MGIDKAPTNDIPQAENENIESSKLEWGPELGQMSWHDAQEKIAELNKNLNEGEKKWRLPTRDELVNEFQKTGSTPLGFQNIRDSYYWSSTLTQDSNHFAYVVGMNYGDVGSNANKNDMSGYVRVVR